MGTVDIPSQVRIEEGNGYVRVAISGNLTQDTDLGAISSIKAPRVLVDIAQLHRFNSRGVVLWMEMIEQLCKNSDLVEIWNAGHAFVQQFSMISRFAATAHIESVKATFVCDKCGATDELMLERKRDYPTGRPEPRMIPVCTRCGAEMVPDDQVFELDLSPRKS
jgi:hypothetical protein